MICHRLTTRVSRSSLVVLLLVILLITIGGGVAAQPKWETYSPPNKRFTVELPWKPHYTQRNTIGQFGGSLEARPIKGVTSVDVFNLSMYMNEERTSFMIYVYYTIHADTEKAFDDEKHSGNKSTPRNQPNLVTERTLVVGGLRAREFIYQKGNVASKALLIFADHRIYAVEFYTEDKKGLARGPVDRVFNSFQPNP